VTDAAQGNPRRSAIREIYAMVQAPVWASPNLDGLADVLRDLSWLPVGPVTLRWQPPRDLPAADRDEIAEVLRRAVAETAGTARPVSVPGVSAG
jgi:barstar (barnase inhibitor)